MGDEATSIEQAPPTPDAATTAWLEESAVELGVYLSRLESKLPEEEVRAWLAGFEE